MGIVRGIAIDQAEPLLETVIDAGLRTIEVTMNTPGPREISRCAAFPRPHFGRGRHCSQA